MTDQHDHDGPDAALRADIRRLGTLLGQTLARQEGRPSSTSSRTSAPRSAPTPRRPRGVAGLDVATGTRLARAFSTYFHLANITEQVHRARDLRRRRAIQGGWLDQAAKMIAERGVPAEEIAAARGGWPSVPSSPPTPPRPPAARS
ncbi:phosphoenolpyruvate carboxylase [Salinispora arenicola]|uniref:phosphoenolpyruvate carboxylase n=1 Tax=Salinispora arenicola TaxID=168697 RepID=UPI0027DB9346|nr:phosphoenolpyruvate carboxylase [Salinispora arenicola]